MIEIPQKPRDVGLPEKFTDFRSSQIAAAARILHAFETTDNVILQAPPGIGKSLLSALLWKLVGPERIDTEERWARYRGGTLVATVTKQLQQQYLDDFPDDVRTATGRDNWPCLLDAKQTAAQAPCTHGWQCPVARNCDYIKQREQADSSHIAVLNTAYYVFEKAFANQFHGHQLVIFDEAHELENALLGFAGKWISPRLFDRLGFAMPRGLELRDDGPWAQFWDDNLGDFIRDLEEAEDDASAQADSGLMNLDPRLAGRLRDLKTIVDIGQTFTQAVADPEHWLLSPVSDGALQLRSIWGYTQSKKLFSGRTKRLFMSGTILSPEFMAFSLGLDNYKYIEMNSDFDALARPLYYVPTVKMSASASSTDLDYLVMVMDAIIKQRHLGQKGIIHTVSYRLRDEIMERSRWRALMVTHNNADRARVLEEFKDKPAGYILVSPSMTTGVDLPADQCRWQMLPKMPFPYLGDEMVRMRKDDDRRLMWGLRDTKIGDLSYAWATATSIVQAYGRAMRSHDDWGHTYLFDSNFGSFISQQRWGPLFPNWFLEAVRWTDPEQLGVEL